MTVYLDQIVMQARSPFSATYGHCNALVMKWSSRLRPSLSVLKSIPRHLTRSARRYAARLIMARYEEILWRQASGFDLVYLHRASNAAKYSALVRYHNPKARLIFSVADLHHLRYARQAHAESRPELMALSNWMRFVEYVAAVSADAVIPTLREKQRLWPSRCPAPKSTP